MAAAMRWRLVLVGALFVFAQLALAAQNCVLGGRVHGDASVEAQCATLPMDGGVCYMHCVAPDQSVATPDQHFTAIAASPARKPLDFTLNASRAPAHTLCDARLHVPRSLQVLYCSYQA